MPRGRTIRATLLAFCLSLLSASTPSFGQSSPASLRATVTVHTAEQPVADATVTLDGPGVRYSARTDARGELTLASVEPGTYAVEVTSSSMAAVRDDGVAIPPGCALQLRAELVSATGDRGAVSRLALHCGDSATRIELAAPLLDHLPLPRRDALTAIPEVLPGISDGSVLGAGAQTSTVRRLDGIDLSDPLDGTTWASYIATDAALFEARLAGAPAAEGGFTGAALDIVSRSGGNRYAGLFDARFSPEGLEGDNLSEALLEQNALLSDAGRSRDATDVSAWLGGPIRHDRAFFGVGVGYASDRDDPAGSRTESRSSTPRVQARVSIATGASDHLGVSAFFEDRSNTGLAPDDVARVVTDDTANRLDGRTGAARVVWQGQISARVHLRASYGFLSGSRDLEPSARVPAHVEGATGHYVGSQGIIRSSDRQRHVVGASLVAPVHAAGTHLLEGGVDFEASRVDEATHFVDDTFFIDFGGRPNLALEWAGSNRVGRNRRLSLYGQDVWTLARRVTVAAGVRLDQLRGSTSDLGMVYDVVAVQPRAGVSVDVTGRGTTIARAHYGRYAEPLWFSHYDRATPGVAPLITYEWLANGARREVEREVTPVYGVDGSLRHPHTQEISAGVEQRVGQQISVGATFVVREFRGFVDAVFPDARWIPVSRPGLNSPVTVYRWANRLASQGNALIRNVDGVEYLSPTGAVLGSSAAERRYRGAILDARYDDARARWNLWASYAVGRSEGTVDDTLASNISHSGRFASPSASLVNVDGRSTHTPAQKLTLLGTIRVPWVGVRTSAIYMARSGRHYAATRQFGNETLDFPQSRDGRQVLLEPRGVRALELDQVLDLRAEYGFGLGGTHRVTAYVDVGNVFNRATVLEVSTLYPVASAGGSGVVAFEAPTRIRAPRRLYLGARWTF